MTPEELAEYFQRTGVRHWEDPSIYAYLGLGVQDAPAKRTSRVVTPPPQDSLWEEVRLLSARVAALEAAALSEKMPPKTEQLHLFRKP